MQCIAADVDIHNDDTVTECRAVKQAALYEAVQET